MSAGEGAVLVALVAVVAAGLALVVHLGVRGLGAPPGGTGPEPAFPGTAPWRRRRTTPTVLLATALVLTVLTAVLLELGTDLGVWGWAIVTGALVAAWLVATIASRRMAEGSVE